MRIPEYTGLLPSLTADVAFEASPVVKPLPLYGILEKYSVVAAKIRALRLADKCLYTAARPSPTP